jgi:phosphate transport system substrate-binding protein
MKPIIVFLILASILVACGPAEPAVLVSPITVLYTEATVPWLPGLYICAGDRTVNAVQRALNLIDLQSGELAMEIGASPVENSTAYQIGSEDIVVILNPRNPVKSLTAGQIRGLFTGLITSWEAVGGSKSPVDVWVFSPGEDIQQLFMTTFLADSAVTSNARLATSMEEMRQEIAGNVNSVGILTKRWATDDLSTAYSITGLPVLVLSQGEPQDAIQGLISCLQK